MNKVGKIINQLGEIIETVSFNPDTKEIMYYELKENEILIENDDIGEFLKPKWSGNNWIETATAEEIAAAEQELSQPDSEIELVKTKVSELRNEMDALLGVDADE